MTNEPASADGFLSNARDLANRRQWREALAALDHMPPSPARAALLCEVRLELEQREAALSAALVGLEIDPKHLDCRLQAAVAEGRLGRRDAARARFEALLADEPQCTKAKALLGWLALEAGDRNAALAHFRAALADEPQQPLANAGLTAALKAKSPLFRPILNWGFFLARLRPGLRLAVVLGIVAAFWILGWATARWPALAWVFAPLFWAWSAFGLLCLLGEPLFNLALSFHPEGRTALPADRLAEARVVSALLLFGVLGVVIGVSAPSGWLLSAGLMALLFVLPAVAAFRSPAGWPRRSLTVFAATLALLALAALGVDAYRAWSQTALTPALDANWYRISFALGFAYMIGVLLLEWIPLLFVMRRPKM